MSKKFIFHRLRTPSLIIKIVMSQDSSREKSGDRVGGARCVGSRVICSGKWLRLEEVEYLDQEGKQRVWERVARTTGERDKTKAVDGVAVRAVVRAEKEEDRFVFVRQFRPAVEWLVAG